MPFIWMNSNCTVQPGMAFSEEEGFLAGNEVRPGVNNIFDAGFICTFDDLVPIGVKEVVIQVAM